MAYGLSSGPLKTLVPQVARLWLEQVSEAKKLVLANGQV